MGKTISITIPEQLEEKLASISKAQGISRSRLIGNILLNWQAVLVTGVQEGQNDCENLDATGFCLKYNYVCKADKVNASTCEGYNK